MEKIFARDEKSFNEERSGQKEKIKLNVNKTNEKPK